MSMQNKLNIGKMTKTMQSKTVKDNVMSGSPRIAGTRIRVRDIVERYIVAKESPAVIAREFSISILTCMKLFLITMLIQRKLKKTANS